MKSIAIIILSTLFTFACQTKSLNRVITPEGEKVFNKLPVPENKPLISLPISQNELSSFHLILLKTEEKPHIHAKHDLSVYVLKGNSWIYLNNRKVVLAPGDFIVIPKGTAHYAVNTGKEPAEVIAVFSPPFDGKDVVPIKEEK